MVVRAMVEEDRACVYIESMPGGFSEIEIIRLIEGAFANQKPPERDGCGLPICPNCGLLIRKGIDSVCRNCGQRIKWKG